MQCATQAATLESGWADAFLTLGRAQLGLGEVCCMFVCLVQPAWPMSSRMHLRAESQYNLSFSMLSPAARACLAEHGDGLTA